MKSRHCAVFITAILVITVLLSGCACIARKIFNLEHTGIASYKTDREKTADGRASEFLPDFNDLSDYCNIEYTYRENIILIFSYECLGLFVTYGDNYEENRNKALCSYDFLKETQYADFDDNSITLPAVSFSHKGYVYNLVPMDYGDMACKCFGMIVYNDEEQKICYLLVYNQDLDCLGKTEEEAVEELKHYLEDFFLWPK